ncbi:DUF475 domain-containing protein (plasmid) [Curtobacterium sp. TC1]|uniref:DUF475 domain-containing protein n=1 Tax=Curtobacterium sp. TC1 TaxID=2862880 RepID=UPI001C9BA45F|nr:DUF475 domain-containing protein [Curtobacterium sp. TC1]QZQ53683.1 DUF475 domain-containing protein [Curtobacterium sp. TC1]
MTSRSLTVPLLITAASTAAMWFALGPAVTLTFVSLAFLEIAMAADSSVPMAGIASRIHSSARQLFLSLGIVVGVLAMRLFLPPAAVAVGGATNWAGSVQQAVFAPSAFSARLGEVRPALAAFGAAFIWLVFAEYLFNTDRASRKSWLGRLEARIATVARPRAWSLATASVGVLVTSLFVGASLGWSASTMLPPTLGGMMGIVAYLVSKRIAAWALLSDADVNLLSDSVGTGRSVWRIHAYASTVVFERGLVVFMLFEILDGVYSLSGLSTSADLGVLEQAAAAIAAIGVGAVFLARLTSRVDQAAGLKRLRYLKAGAAYVLGVLAVLLWMSLLIPIPGIVVSWFGTVVIGLALVTSLPWRAWRRRAVLHSRRGTKAL